MAIIDTSSGNVVLRVVYDGAPETGKTTSVVALAEGLSRPVYTPDQPGERTLFFDWMDYTGGLFEGMRIRCQVVSVPGQALLAARRASLVQTADVVVLVAHCGRDGVDSIVEQLHELRRELAVMDSPRAGILLQLNKRDADDAVPLPALRASLDRAGLQVGVVESIATRGQGVREAFVFAVRLGLDRVRELRRLGKLTAEQVEVEDGEDLLKQILAQDAAPVWTVPATPRVNTASPKTPESPVNLGDPRPSEARTALAAEVAADPLEVAALSDVELTERSPSVEPVPTLPDQHIPSGMIWPPIEGRIVLADATAEPLTARRTRDGWLALVGDRWLLHSVTEAEYADVNLARAELVAWARHHAALASLLSGPRAIVVAPSAAGSWRVWQIVKRRDSLRDLAATSLHLDRPGAVVEALVRIGRRLVEFERTRAHTPHNLPCALDSVGDQDGRVQYIGLMPPPAALGDGEESAQPNILVRLLRPILGDWAQRRDVLLPAIQEHSYQRSSDINKDVVKQLENLFRSL